MGMAVEGIPRRYDLGRMTPTELAIRDSMLVIESMGAHQLLTEAVVCLTQARERVADYIDEGHKDV